jgi:hypothetical protein
VARVVAEANGLAIPSLAADSALEAPEIGLILTTGGPIVPDRIAADVQQIRAVSGQYRLPARNSEPTALLGNLRVAEIESGDTIRKIEARATRLGGMWVGGSIGYLDDPGFLRVVAPGMGVIWGDLGVSGRLSPGRTPRDSRIVRVKSASLEQSPCVGAFRGQAYCVKTPLFSPEQGMNFEVILTPPIE